MRIVSWNRKKGRANTALDRRKHEAILGLDPKPDILILQEFVLSKYCPIPEEMKLVAAVEFEERIDKADPDKIGDRNGLAVFCCNKQITVEPLKEYDYKKSKFYIPMKVRSENLSFNLLAVWNCDCLEGWNCNKSAFRYSNLLSQDKCVVIGDFNWPGNKSRDGHDDPNILKFVTRGKKKGTPKTVKWLFNFFEWIKSKLSDHCPLILDLNE